MATECVGKVDSHDGREGHAMVHLLVSVTEGKTSWSSTLGVDHEVISSTISVATLPYKTKNQRTKIPQIRKTASTSSFPTARNFC